MDEGDDELILAAIRHAALAGGLRIHAARDERLRRGFTKAADRQSAKSANAVSLWLAAPPRCSCGRFS